MITRFNMPGQLRYKLNRRLVRAAREYEIRKSLKGQQHPPEGRNRHIQAVRLIAGEFKVNPKHLRELLAKLGEWELELYTSLCRDTMDPVQYGRLKWEQALKLAREIQDGKPYDALIK